MIKILLFDDNTTGKSPSPYNIVAILPQFVPGIFE